VARSDGRHIYFNALATAARHLPAQKGGEAAQFGASQAAAI
jgi:hypothetical protein